VTTVQEGEAGPPVPGLVLPARDRRRRRPLQCEHLHRRRPATYTTPWDATAAPHCVTDQRSLGRPRVLRCDWAGCHFAGLRSRPHPPDRM